MSQDPFFFKQIELGPMQNFVYLFGDPQTREALIIDPGWSADAIVNTLQAEDYRPVGICVTHTHPDHILAIPELLEHADVPVYIHAAEAETPFIDRSSIKAVDGGDKLKVGSIPVEIIHTPGHTPGSQCFLGGGHLLTGDTLFIKGCGRTDLPGGDTVSLYDSLVKLKALDDKVILYPGHNYADVPAISLGEEKRTSALLKTPSLEAFLRLLGQS